ncbi:MAG: NADP-dependent oxidoreductase [Nocardioides sp.]|nr:NADP-dependent oxidoreductase [Nocardioides sp.]
MTAPTSRTSVRLAARPVGYPDDSTWDVVTEDVPAPGDGQVVVAVDHLSIDPAMRGWLNDVRSYVPPVGLGEVMRALGTGTVVASRHPHWTPGDTVSGMVGVTEVAVVDGDALQPTDLDVAPAPTWLGALGMTGMTAYFGLLDVGRAQAGDTVVVSAAAGAVGSVVGQLAKARGCRVVGIAGGPEKCTWLREIGFDEAIDRHDGPLLKQLRAAAPEGIDVYFDNVGGETLDAALATLRRGARVVLCGAISGYNEETLPPGPRRYLSLLVFRATMAGFVVFDYEDRYPEAVAEIGALVRGGRLVARETVATGGVAAFGQTLLDLYAGRSTGKLVLAV